MRSNLKVLVAAVAAVLVAPQVSMAAEDIDSQLQLMNERMSQLETQLQATQDELDASKSEVARQSDMIEKAGIEREAQSGLSAFLSETQFSGFLAASYTWNFNNPNVDNDHGTPSDVGVGDNIGTRNGENTGILRIVSPHHTNHNNFQVDQFFISMINPADAENRAGWGAELVWGAGADAQTSFGVLDDDEFVEGTGEVPHLYQAYVEYLWDIGEGVGMQLGRWEGVIGAESFRADRNFNVTRGVVWALQPVNHTGLRIRGDCECGFDWNLAVANSYSNTMVDQDNNKTFIGGIGWSNESVGVHLNGLYGGDVDEVFGNLALASGAPFPNGPNDDDDAVGLLDFVVNWDPVDTFSMWFNFDWYTTSQTSSFELNKMQGYAVAAAGRLAVTDAMGISLRGEYVLFDQIRRELTPGGGSVYNPTGDWQLWSITGTVDYALTDNLTAKGEVRYDWQRSMPGRDEFFVSERNGYSRNDQVLGVVQLLYRF